MPGRATVGPARRCARRRTPARSPPRAAPATAPGCQSCPVRAEAAEIAQLAAVDVEIARLQPGLECRAKRRPLAVDDREPGGVPVVAARDHRLPEQPLEAKAQPRGRGAARQVQRVAFPLIAPV